MKLNINGLEALEALLERNEIEAFLKEAQGFVYRMWTTPAIKGKALLIPQMDALLERAARHFNRSQRPRESALQLVAHIATEIYTTGGHTRLIENMVRALPEYRHVLVLTDSVENYRQGRLALDTLKERFDILGVEILTLSGATLTEKTAELAGLIESLAPQAAVLTAHHFDVVANAGITGNSAPRVIFIHHGDDLPSLGATRADLIHADLNPASLHVCMTEGLLTPAYLNLTVKDCGVVHAPQRDTLIGATCGAPYKYSGVSLFSYAALLAALFAAGVEKIFHIGTMPQEQMAQVRSDLAKAGQDAQRIIFMPNTPSLAPALKKVAPDFFLGSHPIGGGTAMTEAMSLGLAIIATRPEGLSPLHNVDLSLGNELVVRTLDDVPAIVTTVRRDRKALGRRSRDVYEKHYSMGVFRDRLLSLIR